MHMTIKCLFLKSLEYKTFIDMGSGRVIMNINKVNIHAEMSICKHEIRIQQSRMCTCKQFFFLNPRN